MKNETPMYLVPGRLTDEQSTEIRREMVDGPILDPADMFVRLAGIIGTPIPPCADVETVGYGREVSFTDLKKDGCHGVSIHKEWDGGIPLVRRTDMEAQVARVAAEKDAEIARLWSALDDIEMGIDAMPDDNEDYSKMSAREMRRQALEVVKAEVKALKGGAA